MGVAVGVGGWCHLSTPGHAFELCFRIIRLWELRFIHSRLGSRAESGSAWDSHGALTQPKRVGEPALLDGCGRANGTRTHGVEARAALPASVTSLQHVFGAALRDGTLRLAGGRGQESGGAARWDETWETARRECMRRRWATRAAPS